MAAKPRKGDPLALAEAIGAVRWDYDPGETLLSPLVATARFFASFPWDGEKEEDEEPLLLLAPGE